MSGEYFVKPAAHAQARVDKPFKHTFLQSERILVGLNTLATGQSQHLHDHPEQDKFYYVLSGTGLFTVAQTSQFCGPGELVLAPAGVPHGVVNEGEEPLTFLTAIAPFPSG